jgi:hypothetical protein
MREYKVVDYLSGLQVLMMERQVASVLVTWHHVIYQRTSVTVRDRDLKSLQPSCQPVLSSGGRLRHSATRCVSNHVTIRGWFRQQPNIYPAFVSAF